MSHRRQVQGFQPTHPAPPWTLAATLPRCPPPPLQRSQCMIELFYWPTPNGKKVTILLEECGLKYKIAPVAIGRGEQFAPAFLKLNPNHRMPVIVDHAPEGGGAPISVF